MVWVKCPTNAGVWICHGLPEKKVSPKSQIFFFQSTKQWEFHGESPISVWNSHCLVATTAGYSPWTRARQCIALRVADFRQELGLGKSCDRGAVVFSVSFWGEDRGVPSENHGDLTIYRRETYGDRLWIYIYNGYSGTVCYGTWWPVVRWFTRFTVPWKMVIAWLCGTTRGYGLNFRTLGTMGCYCNLWGQNTELLATKHRMVSDPVFDRYLCVHSCSTILWMERQLVTIR